MKILVTGASGWLGRHLVPLLRAEGHEVTGLDIAPGPCTTVVASVSDADAVQALFNTSAFDGVIHAGALHKPDIARQSAQDFIDVNMTGTLNLLRAAAARPGTRCVFTSTTSLMIDKAIRNNVGSDAVWLDEDHGPLAPRNIYGVTKLAAEGLCRLHHLETGQTVVLLRTARFFPEADDTITAVSGPNLKANELLHRRATVHDVARAHLHAITRPPASGFGLYIVSAPTPFIRADVSALKRDAAQVISGLYPDIAALYARAGWHLPDTIGRIYDGSRIERDLGFHYETGFADVVRGLRGRQAMPALHDDSYVSPAIGRI